MALTVKEAAAQIGCTEGWLYKLIRDQRIEAITVRRGVFREVVGLAEDVVASLCPEGGEAA